MMQRSLAPLARKLRLLRAGTGLTLIEASKISGVDRGTLSLAERGAHAPSVPTLAKIAKGYGVPVEELLELLEGEEEVAGKGEAPSLRGFPFNDVEAFA